MELDWLTVFAQVVNFLVLVWLLKHFLYQPVIDAMDNRERLIASRLDEADQRKQAAKAQQLAFEEKQAELDHNQEAILEKARLHGEHERQQFLDKARLEIDELRKKWRKELKEEQGSYLWRLREEAARSIIHTTGRVLADLADTTLETRIIDRFIKNLQSLSGQQIKQLGEGSSRLDVTTTFPLQKEQCSRLEQSLKSIVGDRELVFHQSASPQCGIELTGEGAKIDWNIARYLAELEEKMKDLLHEEQRRTLQQPEDNADA